MAKKAQRRKYFKTGGYSTAFTPAGGSGTGAKYLLSDIPKPLWRAFRDKVKANGQSVRATLLQFIADYLTRG
jgi:hypothetical protein